MTTVLSKHGRRRLVDDARMGQSPSSKQAAIEWAKRFMELHKEHWKGWEGETEVRQVIQVPGSGRSAAHG
jgi:hypothetical protein